MKKRNNNFIKLLVGVFFMLNLSCMSFASEKSLEEKNSEDGGFSVVDSSGNSSSEPESGSLSKINENNLDKTLSDEKSYDNISSLNLTKEEKEMLGTNIKEGVVDEYYNKNMSIPPDNQNMLDSNRSNINYTVKDINYTQNKNADLSNNIIAQTVDLDDSDMQYVDSSELTSKAVILGDVEEKKGEDNNQSPFFDPMKIKKFKKPEEPKKPKLTLQAIIVSEDDETNCIIGDKILTVGDEIDQYKVVRIEKNKVYIMDVNNLVQIMTLY